MAERGHALAGCSPSLQHPRSTLYHRCPCAAVFVRGLRFGTPGTPLSLLVDTGSSLTHVVGAGCGSSCGKDRPDGLGFNASASRTANLLPCDNACAACAGCQCAELLRAGGRQYCAYDYSYGGFAPPGQLALIAALQGGKPPRCVSAGLQRAAPRSSLLGTLPGQHAHCKHAC